jgi:hypothetical protein
MVSGILEDNNPRFRYRSGQSFIIPYVPFSLGDKSSEIPIKTITVGPNPNPDLALNSVRDLLGTKGIIGCTVSISKVPYRNW